MFPGERAEWHSSEVYAFREGEAPMRNWLGRTCDRLIQIGEDHGGPEACGRGACRVLDWQGWAIVGPGNHQISGSCPP